ncbi:methyltransferase domain-containing protein [bacterium]|nr:methyltransferase domain-containing protein [bacterium]
MSKAPENWFEDIYADSDISGKGVPWATREPAPLLVQWLDAAHPTGHGEAAMVVGCGLGDDALEMARRGFTVTAFDVAESAIELARERFGELAVDWHVGELFDTPTSWSRAFDVVVEHRTVQSLPPQWQDRGQAAIADFVAPGGQLMLVADLRPAGAPKDGPPWRLRPEELDALAAAGLQLEHERQVPVAHEPTRTRLLRVYRRR